MLNVTLGRRGQELKTLLCLGAHCDDIEIGCGGTIMQLAQNIPPVRVYWVVFSSDPRRADEARQSADKFLRHAADKSVLIKEFRNGYFPSVTAEIKDCFEELKSKVQPDVVFTHYRHDLHQDHRIISELTWNTFRNHLILEYEIPKYDGDLGTPNFFVPLSEALWQQKIATLMECFESQRDKHWFAPETFSALMRLRGVESNSPSGCAEAFYCRKAVLG